MEGHARWQAREAALCFKGLGLLVVLACVARRTVVAGGERAKSRSGLLYVCIGQVRAPVEPVLVLKICGYTTLIMVELPFPASGGTE